MVQFLEELQSIGFLINTAIIERYDYPGFGIGHGSRRTQVVGRKQLYCFSL